MIARDFEEKFWEIEHIVIVLRCSPTTEVGEYDYKRAASGDTTLSELKNNRLAELAEMGISYVIHDGDVAEPHGKTKLSSIRDSYN